MGVLAVLSHTARRTCRRTNPRKRQIEWRTGSRANGDEETLGFGRRETPKLWTGRRRSAPVLEAAVRAALKQQSLRATQ
jgi:hypothetical protein